MQQVADLAVALGVVEDLAVDVELLSGSVAGDEGVSPCSISAVDVSTLNEEPGGNEPSSARLNPPPAGTLTAASTCPVVALTATRAACLCMPDSAFSASCCTARVDARLHHGARPGAERRDRADGARRPG